MFVTMSKAFHSELIRYYDGIIDECSSRISLAAMVICMEGRRSVKLTP